MSSTEPDSMLQQTSPASRTGELKHGSMCGSLTQPGDIASDILQHACDPEIVNAADVR